MVDSLIISFFGGIVGGIFVNLVSIEYQKFRDKREKEKIAHKENKQKVIKKLKEVKLSLENSITSERPRYEQIQNDCLIFSNQITSILSQVIEDIPEEIIDELTGFNSELKDLGDIPLYHGYDFPKDCKTIIDSAKEIIRKIENSPNNESLFFKIKRLKMN